MGLKPVHADANLELVQAEQAQHPHAAGSWLWLDRHAERAVARGELPDQVQRWCQELRAQRALLLTTGRQQRRRRR